MKVPESIKQKIKKRQNFYYLLRYFRNIFLSIIDIFAYRPLAFGNNLNEQSKSGAAYSEVDPVKNMIKQRKYDEILPYIAKGDRILDIACGGGELQEILRSRFKIDVDYFGVDYDEHRVRVGLSNGRNVHLLDASNQQDLLKFIKKYGPFDTIFCVYCVYFFPKPEAFLSTIRGKSKRVILGGFNGGHWSYRFRLLFGRGPCPSPTRYYVPNQVNYEEMRRFWTLRDYKFVCESLGYKIRMISTKSAATSRHFKPKRFLCPSLSALGFIFLLEPEEQSKAKTVA